MTNAHKVCPCGSGLDYQHCCGPLHRHHQLPSSPEALMRSRYSAYCLGDIGYIQDTMQGNASVGFDAQAAEQWAKRVIWIGLEVVSTQNCSDNEAQVEFIASFVDGKTLHHIHERSTFLHTQGRWFYVDGQSIPHGPETVSRNGVCPCGSRKKWKHCHGKF